MFYSGDDQDHPKFVMLKIDSGEVTLDEEHSLKVRDVKGENVLKKITGLLPPKQCCFTLYDCSYETPETAKEHVLLIMWTPHAASVREKMHFATSYGLPGIMYGWPLDDDEADERSLVEILKPEGTIKTLEGRDL